MVSSASRLHFVEIPVEKFEKFLCWSVVRRLKIETVECRGTAWTGSIRIESQRCDRNKYLRVFAASLQCNRKIRMHDNSEICRNRRYREYYVKRHKPHLLIASHSCCVRRYRAQITRSQCCPMHERKEKRKQMYLNKLNYDYKLIRLACPHASYVCHPVC